MPRYRKYTKDLLADAVRSSTSVSGVLRHLGLNQAGGTHAHISRMIKLFELDTSHFVLNRNGAAQKRLRPEQILVRISPGAKRRNPALLRRALCEIGRPQECALCGNPGSWLGNPLRLEIDHIDGDYHNNEPGNLRLLCPNCHTQTPNYAGRSRGRLTRGIGRTSEVQP